MKEQQVSRVLFFLGPALLLIILALPLPLNLVQKQLAAIMTLVMCWWLNPLMPLAATGLIGVSLATAFGVSDFARALEGFSNPVIFLFMGGFFLAEALKANQLDEWLARKFLSLPFVQGNPKRLFLGIVLLSVMFSGILSNTATAAMFIPIALSLFDHLKISKEHPSSALILMVAWASTIGGVSTPIGSTPNVIGLSLLQKTHGINVSFFEWMLKATPVMIVAILGMLIVFRKELRALSTSQNIQGLEVSPMTSAQRRLTVMLVATIMLWLTPGVLQLVLGLDHPYTMVAMRRIPEGLVAIGMSSLLFLIPGNPKKTLLEWHEAARIDWGTLLLFGSGIALGQMMFDTGLAKFIGDLLPFNEMPFPLALLILVTGTLFFTEIASNTATANLLIPVILSTAPFTSYPFVSVMCVAMSANMAFMLPVGTPPNAIIFGSGLVKLEWMIKKGFWLNITCALSIWLLALLMTL